MQIIQKSIMNPLINADYRINIEKLPLGGCTWMNYGQLQLMSHWFTTCRSHGVMIYGYIWILWINWWNLVMVIPALSKWMISNPRISDVS
jgi:hypothetical protein